MLVLCNYQIMGCGRSKPGATKDGSSDNDQDSKSKKSKASKHDKVADKKENIDPAKTENKNSQNIIKPVITKKQEVETGKLKTRRPTPAVNSNGTMQEQTIHSELHVVKQERIDAHFTSSYKDKHYPGSNANQNSNIRMTNSQLEFFKMLDEKIERGRDYTSEDDLSQTIDIQSSTSSRIDYTQENIIE